MAADRSKSPVGQIQRCRRPEEHGRLHDPRREDNFIARWIVVGVDGGSTHIPFVSVRGFAQFRPFTPEVEFCDGQLVLKEGAVGYLQSIVILLDLAGVHQIGAFGGISDFLDDVADLLNAQFFYLGRHPGRLMQCEHKAFLDVPDDLITQLLGGPREEIHDVEPTQTPGKALI